MSRGLGPWGEQVALKWLLAKGYRLLECNYRCPQGEIDLIVREGAELVFVEVKTRSSERFGAAAAAVGAQKQQRIRQVASHYVVRHYRDWPRIRFDVVLVMKRGREITVRQLRHAF